MKEGFCLNSRRWISVIGLKGSAPKSCPLQQEQFMKCQDCGYYEERKPTKYLLKIKGYLKAYENGKKDKT